VGKLRLSLAFIQKSTIEQNFPPNTLWVGSGKLLLVFASTVILGFESGGNHDHIILSYDSESRATLTPRLTRLTTKLLLALASKVILGSESHWTHDHVILSDGFGNLQTSFLCNVSLAQSSKLLLVLASIVILVFGPLRTHYHIFVLSELLYILKCWYVLECQEWVKCSQASRVEKRVPSVMTDKYIENSIHIFGTEIICVLLLQFPPKDRIPPPGCSLSTHKCYTKVAGDTYASMALYFQF
jgi:hypothetical protein